ncbi:hypothetical protein FBEOM_8054 [Fusarium beomiforme]|uniref:Uncharacterized protein n=1 Tax=Fusarium beomiforme TaxID=44412 RepID=A0A9P5AG14_9HYPO|nr:hypothetical protein FBEOM_8054 [Fusarium beomiforme]
MQYNGTHPNDQPSVHVAPPPEERAQQQYLQLLSLEVQRLKEQRDRDPVIQALTKRNKCLEEEIQYLHTQAMVMAMRMGGQDRS